MKTEATKDLERRLTIRCRKAGSHFAFEVGFQAATHLACVFAEPNTHVEYPGIVDAMQVDNYLNFTCYELKVTKSDFHSSSKLTFIGNKNYYVMPLELFEEVKNEIPKWVGVLVPSGDNGLVSAKPAKSRKMEFDKTHVLLSMITATHNKTTLTNLYENDHSIFGE